MRDELTQALWDTSLEWCTPSGGDVECPTTGYYSIVEVTPDLREAIPALKGSRTAAFIVTQDNYGFLSADGFETVAEAEATFEALEASYGGWLGADEADI